MTDVRDEEDGRLRAQAEAAIAALNKHKASRSNKKEAPFSTEAGPSRQPAEAPSSVKNSSKAMTFRQRMNPRARNAPKPVSEAPANASNPTYWGLTHAGTAGASDNSWNTSTDAGPSGWTSTDAGPSDNSLNASDDAGPSGFENSVDDDERGFETMKCKYCKDWGHFADACPKKEPIKCYNCGEAGHMKSQCPKPPKKREPVKCFNCLQEGHMKSECTSEKVIQCRNCDEIGHHSKECPKPRDWSRVECRNCGEKGHTAVRCKQPAPSQPSQPSSQDADADAGFDKVDSNPTCNW